MPRGKDHRRARARNFVPMDLGPTGHPSPSAPSSRSGTGFRHPVRRWPVSSATGKSHKCLVPPESPGEKFVLVVGDSHLRALVDGIVRMPGGGGMTFGFMSTPGASAAELYKEVRHANIPRTPDLVCLLAPSNNLTASRTLPEAAVDFRRLLTLLQSKWSKLFVLDFPPRLTVAPDLQTFLRQDFNRVAAQMGIKYLSVAEHFSLDHLELWARDGVHLSDDGGMVLLASLLWNYSALQLVEPEVQAPPPASPRPAVRRVTPKVVVREHPVSPPPTNPFEWACKVGKAKKASPSGADRSPLASWHGRGLEQAAPLPVSPVRFSPAILDLMDKFYPSDLDCAGAAAPVPAGNKTSRARRGRRAVAASQRAAPRPQAEVPEHVEVKPRPSPARRARKERVPAQDRVGVTPRSPTKDVTVERPVDQDQQQRGQPAAGGKKSSKGGAGTGKSHLIRAIQYEATRLLSPLCLQPDAVSVLLTAPTGIAAYSLKAATIHTTFGIGTEFRLPYSPLGEEKLNSMRVKYHDLQILIIDEISMVDHRLLIYIHGRLRQIKQTGDFSPFGKVSIIAVGDFYQLPPVRGKPLYAEKSELNLWSMCFKVVELTEIVRQKDQAFAQMLNRLRTRTKDTKLLPSDVQMLKQCETGEDSTALHIFPTNAQVFQHNLEQLKITCEDFCEIVAEDFIPSKETGKLQLMSGHHKKVKNSCLEERLLLGVNARVMLCKNLDITDGLVNGACGIVTHIESYTEGGFPKYVYVKFDDEEIGKIARRTCAKADLPGSTAIEPEEERVSQKGGMRRQFPLKLAWACTVHKVQGLTVDQAVVSFNKIFAAGQVYVALSRVRTIEGLIIRDFKEKAIYCNKHAKAALEKMPPLLSDERRCDPSSFSVFLLNVQGLCRHVSYLAHCTQQLQPNCIAVTETWLTPSSALEAVQMDGFSFHSRPRGLSYSGTNPALVGLKSQQHGGVGIYCTDEGDYQILDKPDLNLECVVYRSLALNLVLAVVYRPPSYPVVLFRSHLQDLVLWLETQSESVVVMGDFNEDILKSSSIFNLMTDRGFRQHVTSPTTERGETIIDHVYVKTSKFTVKAVVSQIYFSDHEGILCSFSAS
ncbi:uncharacterized protein LOC101163383 isoform X1 [Oryzias latipes]